MDESLADVIARGKHKKKVLHMMRCPIDSEEEITIRELLAASPPFDESKVVHQEGRWAWQWVARLLATLDDARGHRTCTFCHGRGFVGKKVCKRCLGDGATRARV